MPEVPATCTPEEQTLSSQRAVRTVSFPAGPQPQLLDQMRTATTALPALRTRLTLRPHQRGAKQLLAQYGNRLVCVRYRYDERRQKRLKTVELIIEEIEWIPDRSPRPAESVVDIRVAGFEVEVRRQVKGVGGRWRPQRGCGRYGMTRWWR
jgi:hypothetical protein